MKSSSKRIVVILILIYAQLCFILGLRTNIFSIIQSDYVLDYSHIATLVLISGIAMQVANYLSGRSIKKFGYKLTLTIGLSIVGMSILAMTLVNSIVFFDILFTIYMFGFGFCILVLNMYTGVLASKTRAKALMMLHFGASIGLSVGPKFLSELLNRGLTWQLIIGLSSIPIFILIILLMVMKQPKGIMTDEKSNVQDDQAVKHSLKSTVVLMFILIYICAQIWEYGVGTWFIIFARKTNNLTESQAASYLTIFLLSFPISRLLLWRIVDFIGEYRTLFISFIANFILVIVGLITNELLFIALTGIFTSLSYPVIMAMMQEDLGQDNAELIGWVCMMGGILQYIFMWSVGKLGDIFGIRVGFGSLIIYMVLGAVSVVILHREIRKDSLTRRKSSDFICESSK